MSDRIANSHLRSLVMSAEEAAEHINDGDTIGMSGFTGAAYPKALPTAIAEKAKAFHGRGDDFKVNVLTGASTAPDADGVMAEADAINFRMPYQSDPVMRKNINAA